MELFSGLIGNDKIKKTLAQDIFSGTNSHAYILEGPEGSGKHTTAYLAGAALFCECRSNEKFPCGKCLSCKKALSGISTDIILVSKGERSTLGVDVIRDTVKSTLWLAPTEMNRKVYVIEDADKMTPEAQNSLLLSLEEPPEFVFFFLLCADQSKLLETIKSRAPILKCELFSNEAVRKYLTENEKTSLLARDADKLDYAVSASGGALGAAVSHLLSDTDEGVQMRKLCIDTVDALCSSSALSKTEALSRFPRERADTVDLLENIRCAMRDLLALKKHKNAEMLFFTDIDEAKRLSSRVTVKKIMDIAGACAEAENDVSSNLNVQAVLTLLASKIK